MLFILRNNLTN